MLFNFKRRSANFGNFNNRRERNGPQQKVKAIDLPVEHKITRKELDMLVPTQGVPLSEFMLGANPRKSQLQTFVLPKLHVARHPEHLDVVIHDNKRSPYKVGEAKVKDPLVTFEEDGSCTLSYKLQFHPGKSLDRLSDNIEEQQLEYECKSTAPELFDEEAEDDEDAADGGEQADLAGEEADDDTQDDNDD